MLTADDLDAGKGRLCIFTDNDKPCASMLVFVHGATADVGNFKIEYIRATRLIKGKLEPVQGDDLTPVEHWGLRPTFNKQTGVVSLIPMTAKKGATYKDGRTRAWQGEFHVAVCPDLIEYMEAFCG